MTIQELLEREDLLEIGRIAVQQALIELRDSRVSIPVRGNGLVVREKDGKPSHHIRLGTVDAIKIALRAIIEEVEK